VIKSTERFIREQKLSPRMTSTRFRLFMEQSQEVARLRMQKEVLARALFLGCTERQRIDKDSHKRLCIKEFGFCDLLQQTQLRMFSAFQVYFLWLSVVK